MLLFLFLQKDRKDDKRDKDKRSRTKEKDKEKKHKRKEKEEKKNKDDKEKKDEVKPSSDVRHGDKTKSSKNDEKQIGIIFISFVGRRIDSVFNIF